MAINYTAGAIVTGLHCTEAVNKAIALPKELKADDGRVFKITGWSTYLAVQDTLRITADLIVTLPADFPSE